MQDEQKTKSQLISELQALRQEAARLESSLYECKQAEEALQKDHKASDMEQRESERKFKGLFTGMSAGVVFCKAVYDENGNMTDSILKDMNPVYEKLANLKKETAIGRKVSEMLRGIGPEWFSTFDEVLKTGNSVSFEMYHENSKKYYSIFGHPS